MLIINDLSLNVCTFISPSSIKQSDKYSQLILTSPSAADTGSYSCWVVLCDGTECEKDPDRTSVSYIYFTGEYMTSYTPKAVALNVGFGDPQVSLRVF